LLSFLDIEDFSQRILGFFFLRVFLLLDVYGFRGAGFKEGDGFKRRLNKLFNN
jgi:hypothetical protein